jgi:CRISPR/Cas system-associated protein Csm6
MEEEEEEAVERACEVLVLVMNKEVDDEVARACAVVDVLVDVATRVDDTALLVAVVLLVTTTSNTSVVIVPAKHKPLERKKFSGSCLPESSS